MDRAQCRMARVGLGWRGKDLAERAGVGQATLARFELGETIAEASRAKIEKALADAGVQFTDRGGRIGVSVPE